MGLVSLIRANIPCVEVIEASNLEDASSQICNCIFDLVLVGMGRSSLGPIDSPKLAREASPATRVVIISASDTRADILATLDAGFHGFISKHQSETDILIAIKDILSDRIYVPSLIAEIGDGDALDGWFSGQVLSGSSTEAAILKLTKRQREVLLLLAQGKSNKEIARSLDIAEATTKIHLAALLRVLGVRNRTEAAYKAGKLVNLTPRRSIP
jgi:DNA-binding NarL/FixJ family response regulator